MHTILFVLRPLSVAIFFSITCVIAAPAGPRAQQGQNDDDEIRKIWDDGLVRKRRASNRRNYKYRRVTPALPADRRARRGRSQAAQLRDVVVGVTVWRLRPSRATDEVRELVHGASAQSPEGEASLTAERMEADASLDEGEHVRVSIESPRAGYLYVINRELYADGTQGRPLLIFPTERTLGGNNRVQAGRMVTIPAVKDDPPYFTVRPNRQRKDQVAELLLFVISDKPLNLPTSPEAQTLPAAWVNELEKRWGAAFERFEQIGGVGAAITPEEFAASGGEWRELTQGDPVPQTVYRVRARPGGTVLLSLKLPFKRSGEGGGP